MSWLCWVLLRRLGWLSTDLAWFVDSNTAMIAVILPTIWKSFPFFVITMLAALQSIPATLYEAARVDGATAWQQFVHVTWPGIRGAAMLAVLTVAFAGASAVQVFRIGDTGARAVWGDVTFTPQPRPAGAPAD